MSSVNNNTKKGKKEKVEVVWPQDCAFVGHLRACVLYEQLTQSQFVLGFLWPVQEEANPNIRSNVVDYLTELFQNVCDFGWQGAHLVVMTKMEDGLVTWADLKKVNKIRKTNVRASGNSNNFNGDVHNQAIKREAGSLVLCLAKNSKRGSAADNKIMRLVESHNMLDCFHF